MAFDSKSILFQFQVLSNRVFDPALKISPPAYHNFFYAGGVALTLCHTLVTMATQLPAALEPLREEIVSQFAKVVVNADDDNKESKDLVVCSNQT